MNAKVATIHQKHSVQKDLSVGLLTPFKATKLEWQAYDFYLNRAASNLAGQMDRDFWYELVLQASQHEPSVRHAIFAIGCLTRHASDYGPYQDTGMSSQYMTSAIKHYNKAISYLRDYVPLSSDDQIPLISCTLFICMESMIGNAEAAMFLILNGISMMLAREALCYDSTSPVTRLIQRMRIYFPLSCTGKQWDDPESDYRITGQESFTSLHDARQSLVATVLSCIRVIQHPGWIQSFTDGEHLAPLAARDQLLSQLDSWLVHAQLLLLPLQGTETYGFLVSLRTLVWLWVTCVVSPSEYSFQRHESCFRFIVDTATKWLHSRSQTNDRDRLAEYFCFETGWLELLYQTSLKCRKPSLRVRIRELMTLTPRREGLMERERLIAAVELVARFETTERLCRDVALEACGDEHDPTKVCVKLTWLDDNTLAVCSTEGYFSVQTLSTKDARYDRSKDISGSISSAAIIHP